MDKVISADGVRICYETTGSGPAVILVGGALCDRQPLRPLATALGSSFTVINYDRRGRGDSGDSVAYAVEREVEDLAAVCAAVGPAALYGHSSGAAVVLQAASRVPATRIVLHEPPFTPPGDPSFAALARSSAAEVEGLLDAGRRGDAIASHLGDSGLPEDLVAAFRTDPAVLAMAHTLLYDYAFLALGFGAASTVPVPALVLAGGDSPPWLIDVSRALARALPDAHHHVFPGQSHVVPPPVLLPVLTHFLA